MLRDSISSTSVSTSYITQFSFDMEQKVLKTNEERNKNGFQTFFVREFKPADEAEVQRIFSEGVIEMITDTAFRALRHHPECLLLYTAMTVLCFVLTMSWWVTGLLPAVVLCGRYFYSRRVIHGLLEEAMNTDMGDIEEHYMKSPESYLWVAELDGKVVGIVAAVVQQKSGGAVELKRMSVDRCYRRCGVGVALGKKVLDFAATRGYSTVVLGTTTYTPAAHQLYLRLGFHCVGVTNGYVTPGSNRSLLERMFYRVRHHHYSLDVAKIN